MPEERGVRARVREALRAELTEAAKVLFAERGYAATTVGEIAARAGVSERTFFRHFAAKEDPVLQPLELLTEAAAARLAARPRAEAPLVALRTALDVIVDAVLEDPAGTRLTMRLNRDNPELRARHVQKQSEWVESLASVLAGRLGLPEGAPAARLPCAVVMATLEKALAVCADEDNFDHIAREFDIALAEVRALFDP